MIWIYVNHLKMDMTQLLYIYSNKIEWIKHPSGFFKFSRLWLGGGGGGGGGGGAYQLSNENWIKKKKERWKK
jgi:hypothetical protein